MVTRLPELKVVRLCVNFLSGVYRRVVLELMNEETQKKGTRVEVEKRVEM